MRGTRTHAGASADGSVDVHEPSPQAGRLVGALAYTGVGRRLLADGDAQGAIAAARAGLAEIGEVPFDPELIDDTDLKLSAAEDRLAAGHVDGAAEVLLDVLDVRTDLHARALSATIVA